MEKTQNLQQVSRDPQPRRTSTSRQRKINAVYNYLELTGITQEGFARMIGCGTSQINRFLRNRGDLYLSTWELLENALTRAGIDWRNY